MKRHQSIIGLFAVLFCLLVMTAGCGKKFVRSASDAADFLAGNSSDQGPSVTHEGPGETRNESLTPLEGTPPLGDLANVTLNNGEGEQGGAVAFSETHASATEAGAAMEGTPEEAGQGDSSILASSAHAALSAGEGSSSPLERAGTQAAASRPSFEDSGGDSGDDSRNVATNQSTPQKGVSFSHGLQDVFFAFDSWRLSDEARHLLETNAEWLKSHPHERLTIEGHCDERGTQAYNYVLGEKRATMVKQYLAYLGVPAHQMVVTSFGKDRPTCRLFTEECFQANRRAHFVSDVSVAVR